MPTIHRALCLLHRIGMLLARRNALLASETARMATMESTKKLDFRRPHTSPLVFNDN